MGSASLNPSEIFRHFTCAVVLTEGEAAAGDVLLESIKKAKLTTVFMSHPLEAWAGLLRLELLGADLDHGVEEIRVVAAGQTFGEEQGPGGGHRQELGHTFNDAEQCGEEPFSHGDWGRGAVLERGD